MTLDPRTQGPTGKPVAYAQALDELTFEIEPATESQLQSAFQPFLAALKDPKVSNPAEAVLVVTTLPQPFLLPELEAMATAPSPDRWDRKQALEGLARLRTPAAWQAILRIAKGEAAAAVSASKAAGQGKDDSLRAYAVLLLAEKGDRAFLPALLAMVRTAPEGLRGDVLRALGFFHDARAYQALFDKLHSATPIDRMNAILGLKNLGTRESIPALLALLNDPEAQVRQVADFALQSLTGQKFGLSTKASREESGRVAEQWRAWWREKGATFTPPRSLACQDW